MIFGASPSKLEEKFINSAASLLFYWRDESAHGTISTVSEIEAFSLVNHARSVGPISFSDGGTLSESSHALSVPWPAEGDLDYTLMAYYRTCAGCRRDAHRNRARIGSARQMADVRNLG